MSAENLYDFDATLARCKAEILEDIASGTVPASVRSFSELHDHVDANCYGGADEAWYEGCTADDAFVSFWNRVQNALNDWLAAGRP